MLVLTSFVSFLCFFVQIHINVHPPAILTLLARLLLHRCGLTLLSFRDTALKMLPTVCGGLSVLLFLAF